MQVRYTVDYCLQNMMTAVGSTHHGERGAPSHVYVYAWQLVMFIAKLPLYSLKEIVPIPLMLERVEQIAS